jgi:hypothetical protein
MNGYDYKLKEKQVFEIGSVAGGLDDLRSEFSATSNENTKRVDNALGEVCMSIDALASQMVILNKTMGQIVNAIETNNYE